MPDRVRPPHPLRTADIARAVGVDLRTIRRLASRGLLPHVRDYRGWRAFAPSAIERARELLGYRILEECPLRRKDKTL